MNAAKVAAANGAKTGKDVMDSVASANVSEEENKSLTSF